MNNKDFLTSIINGNAQVICVHCDDTIIDPHGSGHKLEYDQAVSAAEGVYHICPGVDQMETLRGIKELLEMFAGLLANDTALINYIDERVREKLAMQAKENTDEVVSGSPVIVFPGQTISLHPPKA